jgi:hypothetical protein
MSLTHIHHMIHIIPQHCQYVRTTVRLSLVLCHDIVTKHHSKDYMLIDMNHYDTQAS